MAGSKLAVHSTAAERRRMWKAMWIQDPRFDGLNPINIFHRASSRGKMLPALRAVHPPELRNVHLLARRSFRLDRPVRSAVLNITADDYYKLYVNGHFVGQGPAPSYHFRYFYNTWDLTGLLREGENVIAAHVYYQGLMNTAWVSGDLRMGLIAELRISLVGGGEEVIGTDLTWKATVSRAWPAAPIPMTVEWLMGLSPLRPGWDAIRFAPHVPRSIEFARLRAFTRRGPVEVKFERGGRKGGFFEVIVPAGVEVRNLAGRNVSVRWRST
jgi:hypothetical protein